MDIIIGISMLVFKARESCGSELTDFDTLSNDICLH